MKKKTLKAPKWNTISVLDLIEDCHLMMKNGLMLKYIGQVDCYSNQDYLFKVLYSPFATNRWIKLTPEQVYNLKVKFLIK